MVIVRVIVLTARIAGSFNMDLPKTVKLTDTHYLVRSKTDPNKVYHITKWGKGWKCGCPRHIFTGKCAHIDIFLSTYYNT
jgi:hypothetical protein